MAATSVVLGPTAVRCRARTAERGFKAGCAAVRNPPHALAPPCGACASAASRPRARRQRATRAACKALTRPGAALRRRPRRSLRQRRRLAFAPPACARASPHRAQGRRVPRRRRHAACGCAGLMHAAPPVRRFLPRSRCRRRLACRPHPPRRSCRPRWRPARFSRCAPAAARSSPRGPSPCALCAPQSSRFFILTLRGATWARLAPRRPL